MTKNYYEKYWQEKNDSLGHANHTPRWPKQELEMFYASVKNFIGRDILDIGAGEGIFIEYLKKRNSNVENISALEISSKAAEMGGKRNPSVAYFVGSADETYPFADKKFDTLFMTDVIEHLVDIDQAISECDRILKEGGKLIIITPVFNWLKKIIIASFFWEKFFYPNNPHIRFFTKKSMDLIMREHGFERVYYRWGLSWFGIMPQNAYFVYKKINYEK
jgi:ubiquinone/menaquinone biosynthesis C-methylase UbiE